MNSSRPARAGLAGVVVTGLALFATACGGGGANAGSAGVAHLGSNSKSTTTTVVANGQPGLDQSAFMAKLLAYSRCMRSHGIADFPDPQIGPNGQGGGFQIKGGPGSDLDPNSPQFEAANRACQALLPNGGTLPAPTAAQQAEYTKFAACMRQHGFPNFPDPNGQGVFVFHNFDLSSPEFEAAEKTCRSIANFSGPMRVQATNSGPSAPGT
ncbi:MAG TPA: hypothetical protein VL984_01800 [Acidimicrobiales bacterium]|nr:hypothetical protein [Acidimicrobiales bacterium]